MRYLILSDIHGNLAALEAVLEAAGNSYDKVWCLGDIVGYGPFPNESIARLRAMNPLCVAGNHDWAALGRLDLDEFSNDARYACLWTQKALTQVSQEYLEELPERIVVGEFTLVHGSPRQPIWEYILSPSIARSNFEYFETPYCLVGHTHVPVVFRQSHQNPNLIEVRLLSEENPLLLGEDRLLINPGSVGQPRDGDNRAAFAILDDEARTLEYRRVIYPIEVTQKRMQETGLPIRLIARLTYGW